jgi:hypothetical protein
MARVTGPLFSMTASGTLNKTAVYSGWKGRAYVRTHVIPHNPKTAAQVGIRAMMKFLSQQWATIKAAADATWLTSADALKVSTFNAYVKANMAAWREFKGPCQLGTMLRAKTASTVTLGTPAGGARNIVLSMTPAASADQWAFIIYRDSATITVLNWNNVIAIVPIDGTNAVQYTDAPLDAGTYHYRVALCTTDGVIGTACADQSGVAA